MTRPWGGKVSGYLWTKSIAAGALLVPALAALAGASSGSFVLGAVPPLLALIFLAITTALLVLDLKRPDRFHYILFKGNPRSWLVWGAWILIAYGLFAALWLLGAVRGGVPSPALALPVVLLAAAAAGYSAFLFGQAEGRDFWQSPLVLPQLLAAAFTAGAASLLVVGVIAGANVDEMRLLAWTMVGGLLTGGVLLVAEFAGTHANVDVARAARLVTRGHFRTRFWAGVVLAGLALPLVLVLTALDGGVVAAVAALLALAGLWIYEDVWVKAGQSVPLS